MRLTTARMLPPLALLALLAVAGWGCGQWPVNNELSVGTGQPGAFTPAFVSDDSNDLSAVPIWTATPKSKRAAAQPEPSVDGLSREHWALTPYIVPNDFVAHNPVYTKSVFIDDDSPRNQGAYPTAQSALDMPTAYGQDQQIAETLVAPVAAAIDLVLFPIRAVNTRPWQVTRTGFEPYRRGPGPGAYLAAPPRPPNLVIPPIPDPAAAPVPVQDVPPPMDPLPSQSPTAPHP